MPKHYTVYEFDRFTPDGNVLIKPSERQDYGDAIDLHREVFIDRTKDKK